MVCQTLTLSPGEGTRLGGEVGRHHRLDPEDVKAGVDTHRFWRPQPYSRWVDHPNTLKGPTNCGASFLHSIWRGRSLAESQTCCLGR